MRRTARSANGRRQLHRSLTDAESPVRRQRQLQRHPVSEPRHATAGHTRLRVRESRGWCHLQQVDPHFEPADASRLLR